MSGLWRHPSDAWLHKIVERQARRTPLSYAIEWHRQGEEEPLLTTYADLKIQADQLAQGLREFLHAKPTTTIAVCLPKSPHLYVAILAVLSLGHTWTPIDPAAPKARKVELLRALGTCLLYIDDELLDFTPPSAVLQVVSSIQSDSIARGHLGEHESDAGELLAASSCDASTPCHILWTSGSTGSPKGRLLSEFPWLCLTLLMMVQAWSSRILLWQTTSQPSVDSSDWT
jgi:acyl-coenzyme A synthetase/AMP-(fatty) acid ligase